jgi:hypothetical protein
MGCIQKTGNECWKHGLMVDLGGLSISANEEWNII